MVHAYSGAMEYAYLGSNAISFTMWGFLYWRRKDLRTMMLIMSTCALPLALFDLVFVPAYWSPVTLLDIPIGIEGFLYSFSVGGVAAALYSVLANRKLQRILPWRVSLRRTTAIPIVSATSFWVTYGLGVPNPEIAAYIAMATGLAVLLYMRRDLARTVLWGSFSFGVVYFLALRLWVTLFPEVHAWFTFQGLPHIFIWSVPGWEALFGFFLGAYWSNLYQALFGYTFAPAKKNRANAVFS